jgi:hypothetical protein
MYPSPKKGPVKQDEFEEKRAIDEENEGPSIHAQK